MHKFGSVKKKIILTLLGGVGLSFSRSPQQYYRVLREIHKEWKKIDQRNFNRSIRRLSNEKLIEELKLSDGSFRLVLTKKGEQAAKLLKFFGDSIKFEKPKKWDKKWRIVIFDIPEKDRAFRAILREHLYSLEFQKLQHSVFVSPYPCEKSILKLVLLYSAGTHVRVITAVKIDNEAKLKKHFFK